jgi:hypothetical protein
MALTTEELIATTPSEQIEIEIPTLGEYAVLGEDNFVYGIYQKSFVDSILKPLSLTKEIPYEEENKCVRFFSDLMGEICLVEDSDENRYIIRTKLSSEEQDIVRNNLEALENGAIINAPGCQIYAGFKGEDDALERIYIAFNTLPKEQYDLTLEEKELFAATVGISELEAKQYIQENIIPDMARRRNRTEPFTPEEVAEKLNRPRISGKQGEINELFEEDEVIRSQTHAPLMFPGIALELADIAYYCLQPNYKLSEADDVLVYLYADGWALPYMFCIVKYLTRLKSGDSPNYKEEETKIMTKFLEYLKLTWKYPWISYTVTHL